MTITTQTPRASTIDTVQQEMPTQSEENNQHRYDALGGRDADALLSSIHQGDRQERDRRVWRSMIFIASTGLAMIVAATFATVLELSDFWQTLWLAICVVFTLLFFVGCFASARNSVEKLVTSFVRASFAGITGSALKCPSRKSSCPLIVYLALASGEFTDLLQK